MKNSKVYKELLRTKQLTDENEMRIKYSKTKEMVFNPCTGKDFQSLLTIDDQNLEVVEEIRLLGLVLRSDMK